MTPTLKEIRRDTAFFQGLMRRQPFQCLVQLTNRCNMKCPFCDFWPNGVSSREELSLEELTRLSRELAELGTFLVSLEGGEPFVRLDLVEIVRAFAEKHIAVLYTNGWYVDEAAASALFGAGLAQVGVSIDFADAGRHDAKRHLKGASERAWRAVDHFREVAPHGGRQVHVMTVVMEETLDELEPLLEESARHDVGHCVTLLSTGGFRRAIGGELPSGRVGERLLALWRRFPHFRIFRDYLELMDPFLSGRRDELPACRAGSQSFNVDHVGNVSPCIEKIDEVVGNVRQEPLPAIHARMSALESVRGCQACWTACRGFGQLLGDGGTPRGLWDLAVRMRST